MTIVEKIKNRIIYINRLQKSEVISVLNEHIYNLALFLYNEKYHIRSPPLQILKTTKIQNLEENKMSDYRKSFYVLNKFSESIVYEFNNEIKEITLEDYLKDNPMHTKEDFRKFKDISDELYHNEDLADTRYRKKKLSIHTINEMEFSSKENILDKLVKSDDDDENKIKDTYNLLYGKNLTELQKKRFIKHFYLNKTLREIAIEENVHFTSVQESIKGAVKKLKKFFEEI